MESLRPYYEMPARPRGVVWSPQHQMGMRLASLLLRAPAGGPFNEATCTMPTTCEGGPTRFVVENVVVEQPGGGTEHVKFEVTITPLPTR